MALTSFHPSGYVREQTVRWLAGLNSGREVPFLLLRMNDWVQPIRSAARDAMERRLDPDHADALIQALPLLLRLPRWGRDGHEAFVRVARRLLAGSPCSEARRRGLASPDPLVRRELFALSLDSEPRAPAELLSLALADSDARIRLWAAQKLRAHPEMEALSRLLDVARRDPFPPVRADALRTLARQAGPAARPALEEALLDPHPSVRRTAKRALQTGREAPFDAAALYRQHLASPDGRRLCAAVLGLGETGTPADAERLAPLTAHPRARVRRAAVHALAALDLERQADSMLAALRDESARVSNEAERALLRQPYIAAHHAARLAALAADEAAPAHARRNARAVLDVIP